MKIPDFSISYQLSCWQRDVLSIILYLLENFLIAPEFYTHLIKILENTFDTIYEERLQTSLVRCYTVVSFAGKKYESRVSETLEIGSKR